MSLERQSKETKQILTRLSLTLLFVGLSICLFILLYLSQKRLVELGELRYQSNLLADQLRQSSDDLTRLVRTYAVTANQKFEKQYWEVLAIRNGKIPRPLHYDRIYWDFLMVKNGKPPCLLGKAVPLKRLMKEAGFSKRELTLLAESQKNSDELVLLEKQAMEAVKGKITSWNGQDQTINQQKAIDILFGEEYHQAKVKIMTPINTFLEELDSRTHAEVHREAFHLKLLLFFQVITFILIISTVIGLLRIAKKYHTSMVSLLFLTVKERTTELERSNTSLQQKIEDYEKAEQKIKVLKGLLPICASCKKIRDDKGYWNQIEAYIQEHSEAEFSHGICPECVKRLYPKLDKNAEENKQSKKRS